jgi:ferric-dicitrate binding protein FerR (iron transport regulator)
LDIKLLTKYIAGEAAPEEVQSIERWLEESPDHLEMMNKLEKIWDLASEEESGGVLFNTNQDWAVLQSRIEDDNLLAENRTQARGSIFGLNTTWSIAVRVAAIFLLAGLFGLYTYKMFYTPAPENPAVPLKEITMNPGLRGGVTLSDGTKVYLNSHSKITLPSVFSADTREVTLEGEAYFEVAKNPNKPFIIKTKGAIVQVLGTSFVVRSYEGDKTVQTVVEEGVVSFRPANMPINEGVILTKGKLARLNLKNNMMETEQVDDLDIYLSWKDGYLKFKNTTMKEVAKQLERKYAIKVEFDCKKIADLHLTAELKSRSMKNVIQTISNSLDLHYHIDDKKITFSY